ncbi:MAG: GNAT family N-acetyltransferase [Planctomycetota bacterium]
MANEWTNPEHAQAYLARMEEIPHRGLGETTLLSEIPADAKRVLDLGCGDGRLLGLVLDHCSSAAGVGLDMSITMLEQSRKRFDSDPRVRIVEHNMDDPLPDLGRFDCVVSSFAIHHCTDVRKREIYSEAFAALEPSGVCCNLEHVSSPSERIHHRFVEALGITPEDEDPSNKLLDVEIQLRWLRETGFKDVDCHWKWRELALLAGRKPSAASEAADLSVDHAPTPAEVQYLDDQLEAFNAEQVGRDDFSPLNLVIRQNGNVIAGLKSVAGWDWMYVQILWVHTDFRRQGLGGRLLQEAEQTARGRGCVGSCLSSFSFQAPEFYRARGYRAFGQIEEYPSDQTLFFLSKRLDATS